MATSFPLSIGRGLGRSDEEGGYAVVHLVGSVGVGVVLWASCAWIAPSLLHAGEVFPMSDNPAVSSNNEFAVDLYQHLAKGNAGTNLFFSPYSLFSALLMAVEGARGETAHQMGVVLRFPSTAQNTGAAAKDVPWDMTLLHRTMAAMRQRLAAGGGLTAEQKEEIQSRLRNLEEEHKVLTQKVAEIHQYPYPSTGIPEVVQRNVTVAEEINTLRQQIDPYELNIANALWGEQTFPFRQDFLTTLNTAYSAAAFPADFRNHAAREREQINQWVAQQTKERIKNILAPGTLSSATRLVLANAIYFKGKWQDEFDKKRHPGSRVHRADQQKEKIKLMGELNAHHRYVELLSDGTRNMPVFNREKFAYDIQPNTEGFQLLELPYRGKSLSMIVLLPKKANGLPALEKQLTIDNLNKWIDAMQDSRVHIYLPKFTLETFYSLPPVLAAMGMPAAFQAGGFTGMSDVPDAKSLALSEIAHKAFVEVNEEGTEAAAATVSIWCSRRSELNHQPRRFVRIIHLCF